MHRFGKNLRGNELPIFWGFVLKLDITLEELGFKGPDNKVSLMNNLFRLYAG